MCLHFKFLIIVEYCIIILILSMALVQKKKNKRNILLFLNRVIINTFNNLIIILCFLFYISIYFIKFHYDLIFFLNISKFWFNKLNIYILYLTLLNYSNFVDDNGDDITIRGCALDSGTLTTDTEIIRMSHCGGFYYDDRFNVKIFFLIISFLKIKFRKLWNYIERSL